MARIFISYSRVDRPFVDDLVPLLRKVYGLSNVWFDEEILGGHDWWDEILDQIADCDVFVYVLSDRSVGSPYCRAEYTEADRLRKAILPVLMRARTEVPSDLSRIQYVDLSGGVKHVEALTRLYASINQLLGSVPRRPKKPRWPERTPLPNVEPSTVEAKAKQEERVSFPPEPVVTEKSRKKRLQERWSGWSVLIRAMLIALLSIFVIALCGIVGTYGLSIMNEALGLSGSDTPTISSVPTPTSASRPTLIPTSVSIETGTNTPVPPFPEPLETATLRATTYSSTQNPVDITIFRDEDSLTIFVPGTRPVSLQGFQLKSATSDGEFSKRLEDFPSFQGLYFDRIQPPICFRLERFNSRSPVPDACPPGQTLIQLRNDADVFWYDGVTHQDRLLVIFNGADNQMGICAPGQSECSVRYMPV